MRQYMNTVQLYNWQNVHMHVLLLESNAKAFLKHHSLLALEVIIIRRPEIKRLASCHFYKYYSEHTFLFFIL